MTRKSKHVKSKRRTTRRNKTRRIYKRQDKTRRRKKGGARIARSIKNVAGKTVGKLKQGATSVANKFKKNVSEDDKNRSIAIFTHTRDKLRELFSITHNPAYDKEPFDPLDPFPANELDVNNDFIKRLLVNTLCYANLPDKYKKAFKQMVLERYQNNTQYFKEFYYRAFLDIKRLLPDTEELHPFSEFNFCGPGTDVLWRTEDERARDRQPLVGGSSYVNELNPQWWEGAEDPSQLAAPARQSQSVRESSRTGDTVEITNPGSVGFAWMKRLLDHCLGRKEIGTYPYNEPIPGVADSCCMKHDFAFGVQYVDGFDGEKGRFTSNSKESELFADRVMLECIKKKKERGEKLTPKEMAIEKAIKAKNVIQEKAADPRTGKIGDRAFKSLMFSEGVDENNLSAPFNNDLYKEGLKNITTL